MRRRLVSAIAIVLGVGAAFAAREVRADDDRLSKRYKTVLALSAEDLTRPWVQHFIEGVRDAIQKADPAITIYNEFIDGARFDTPSYADELRTWLGQKYRDRKIDLILVQGRQGVEFLAEKHGEPWRGVPVVWGEAGGLRRDVSGELPDTAGVSYERKLTPFLDVIRTILPGTKRVALVYGASPLERYSVLEFDGRQLDRWGIDERQLPAGSQIEFRRSSLWRDYRGAVIGTIAAGILQTLLIAILLYERRRRRLAEMETRQHLVAAAHLNRRSAMGELAASLAHELNQPLGAILHNAEAAAMALDGANVSHDELREILDDIRKDDTRAAEIIRRLSALVRNHELEMQVLDVNTLVRETVELVGATARSKGVQIDLQFDAGTPIVRGDRIHLQQVLLNLLLNSIDAMAVGPPPERQLIVRTSRGADEIGIFVVDAGCGIPEDAVSRIFEPFYTTKGQGMGMGLCIARTIVEAHGGHVGARNNNERGATVWFTLPMAA